VATYGIIPHRLMPDVDGEPADAENLSVVNIPNPRAHVNSVDGWSQDISDDTPLSVTHEGLGGAAYALYDYNDGDSSGWAWDGDAHNSPSRQA